MKKFHLKIFIIIFFLIDCDLVLGVEERTKCENDVEDQGNRIDTSKRLKDLRGLMEENELDAYIVPMMDEHASEYVGESDKIIQFISGFSGSNALAIITKNESRLWTDGRYYLQADDEMDCNWSLMKYEKDVLNETEWLVSIFDQNGKVGIPSRLITISEYNRYLHSGINHYNLTLIDEDLVGKCWSRRPKRQNRNLEYLQLKYTGKRWKDKCNDLLKELEKMNVESLLITELDDIAWLLNLRGSDIEYNPFFYSFFVLSNVTKQIFISNDRWDSISHHYEGVNQTNYNDFFSTFAQFIPKTVLVAPTVNYEAYHQLTMENKIITVKRSPIKLMKSIKNKVERRGMRNANIRDSVARIKHSAWLETAIQEDKRISEIKSAEMLLEFYKQQKYFKQLSFETISAYGSNGAIIHYTPSSDTDKLIKKDSLYLLDAGSQYLDGTTDTTRTMHFGTPTEKEKTAYTIVLKGAIDLASVIFPKGINGYQLDTLARRPFWLEGLNYRHGTGHGIGSYLGVHEGPQSITSAYKKDIAALADGMFQSDEPGVYYANEFGIRLETVIECVSKKMEYNMFNSKFLGFDAVALVPFEPKLIDYRMLTTKQLNWLNGYHMKIRRVLSSLLEDDKRATEWMLTRTEYVRSPSNGSNCIAVDKYFLFISFILFILYI
ncbi:hypothetical protein SNEBB_006860 [Seison nebaliae]|nr:hypothetical protein SNEBB_006860 [Seison nebaliae]